MTTLELHNPRTIVSKDHSFHTVWYNLIGLIGLPIVTTEGVELNSVADVEAALNASPLNRVCLTTGKTENYRTNKVWYTLAR